jgi:hypothetical protein
LANVPRDLLLEDVDAFAQEKGLTDILPVLKKGALVAQDPGNFESILDLDDAEREALRNEIGHRWKHPRLLYLTIIVCSIGAAVQLRFSFGYD